MPARDVKVGDEVFVVSASAPTGIQSAVVQSVAIVPRQGVFNVHTLSGNIVVNNIVASHFTRETTWGSQSRSLAPIWYKSPLSLSVLV